MTATLGERVNTVVGDFLDRNRQAIVSEWSGTAFFRRDWHSRGDVAADCEQILSGLRDAIASGRGDDPSAPAFQELRSLLTALAGTSLDDRLTAATAAESRELTSSLVRLWQQDVPDPDVVVAGAVVLTAAVGSLRLALLEAALRARLDTISSQQEQLTELSTPVIQLWEGVLAVPLIGTLDSVRSQLATESLLQAIVDQQATVAILDITGVPTVDTMVAQHLLKTTMAAQLMGADCVISGIRPQIAHTMVQLGVDLSGVATRARLSDALAYALGRIGLSVSQAG